MEYLSRYNKEVYKFTARVLMDNGASLRAVSYLKKSIDVYYYDPEVHFMLGEAYLKTGSIEDARKEYKISNNVSGGYFPAVQKLKQLKDETAE